MGEMIVSSTQSGQIFQTTTSGLVATAHLIRVILDPTSSLPKAIHIPLKFNVIAGQSAQSGNTLHVKVTGVMVATPGTPFSVSPTTPLPLDFIITYGPSLAHPVQINTVQSTGGGN
jgi:hypothetical protein